MKEIKAYVRISRIDEIVRALKKAGIDGLNIIHVQTVGRSIDPREKKISFELTSQYAEVVKLEIVCSESRVEEIVKIIETAGHTGSPGDGIIYVSSVDDAIKIRTGKRGPEALV